ncbi:CRAL-TRIO domain-containing protein [Bombardia bombarda]|uniref:CRAL-TRIO domain-containing protein n=1 Tax=Bombardia bombarda TaxID=252184 RepID=A0AA40CGJ3_9PEZI|nr:CRAL-TRIO domain-containing protein [Bombardia bombarda]
MAGLSTGDNAALATHDIGYPNGHLGHLTTEEEEALVNFKVYLEEHDLYTPGPTPSHDDQTLLRFLRARRWVVPDAYKQFHETEVWRKANHLDVLYNTLDIDAYEQTRRLYPQWTGRRDRRGIPLFVFEIVHLDSKTVAAYEKSAETAYSEAVTDGSTPSKLLRLFALYESLTRFTQPLCTQLPDRDHFSTPITLSTNIVDVSGVSLRQFWNLKSHMQAASQLATAHYPETLDRIFIIGAPYFFSTVWGWVKRWFDPITVSKIFILSAAEVKPTLEAFIDPKNIPKKYGGELEFNWGDMPNVDPYIAERATWESGKAEFVKGPMYWRPVEGTDLVECVAVGTVDQKTRMQRICTLPKAYPPKPVAVAVAEKETVPAAVAAPTATTNGPTEADIEAVQALSIGDDKPEISEKLAEPEAATKAGTVSA